jgi:hypothetical protein
VRAISLERVVGAQDGRLADPGLRHHVRVAFAHDLGLDIPAVGDGARVRE